MVLMLIPGMACYQLPSIWRNSHSLQLFVCLFSLHIQCLIHCKHLDYSSSLIIFILWESLVKKYRNYAFRTSLPAFKKQSKALFFSPLQRLCGLAFDQGIFLQFCLQTDFFVNLPFSVLQNTPKMFLKHWHHSVMWIYIKNECDLV